MATPIPIDLTQIAWTSGSITSFEVHGSQGAKSLLRDDPTAAVAVAHRAEFAHNTEAGEVAIFLYLGLDITVGTSPKPTGISGRFELDFIFAIGNLSELLVDADQSEPQLHPQLVLLLTSVAYSTARGILWTRLAGTPLEGITLPLINPAQLLQPTPSAVAPPTAVKKARAAAPTRSKRSKAVE
jgi:hypothetical protein